MYQVPAKSGGAEALNTRMVLRVTKADSVAVACFFDPPVSGAYDTPRGVPGLQVSHRTTALVPSTWSTHGPLLTPVESQGTPPSASASRSGSSAPASEPGPTDAELLCDPHAQSVAIVRG